MIEISDTGEFLDLSETLTVLDVRSPSEFSKGHIPQAFNLSLFSDTEKAEVGTLYHKQGRDVAFSAGMEMVSPRLKCLAEEARGICKNGKALLYCQRGGMRSRSVAFLLETAGLEVRILQGGYKKYRGFVQEGFSRPANLFILGGFTGSGKTEMLWKLAGRGHQVLDLEGIARHKGSVFGADPEHAQPSSSHFENLLFERWRKLDFSRPIFLEDESMKIGEVNIPLPLYRQMQKAWLIQMQVPFQKRIQKLTEEYCSNDEFLVQSILKIEKKLGGENTKKAIDYIKCGDYQSSAAVLLAHYDKAYSEDLMKRPAGSIFRVKDDATEIERIIVNA